MKAIKKTAKRKRSAYGGGRLFKKAGTKQLPADSTASGNYYLTYRVNGQRITQALRDTDGKPITDRQQAEVERKRILAPLAAGDAVETLKAIKAKLADAETAKAEAESEANPSPRLNQIWKAYKDSPQAPDSGDETTKRYHSQWKRFKRWIEQQYPEVVALRDISVDMVDAYATDLRNAGYAASTHNQHLNTLTRFWDVLKDRCKLTSNPWQSITRLKASKIANRKQALTAGQLDAVLAAAEATPDIRDLLELLAYTGLREGDAVLMKWGAVDFKQRLITLVPKKTERRTGAQVFIPMMPQVLDLLNSRQSGRVLNPKAYVFPKLAETYQRDPSALSKQIRTVFESAGLETSEKRQGRRRAVVRYGCHSLRHTFVTIAATAGLPDALIRQITGHTSDRMAQHYQQLTAEIVGSMASAIDVKQLTQNTRDPLPAWAAELVKKLDGKTWETIKAELLKGGEK